MKKVWKRIRFIFRIKQFVPFLKEFFLSKEVASGKKWMSIGCIAAYFIIPFDLIPDFVSVFGLIDDLTVLTLLLQQIVKMAPPSLRNKYNL